MRRPFSPGPHAPGPDRPDRSRDRLRRIRGKFLHGSSSRRPGAGSAQGSGNADPIKDGEGTWMSSPVGRDRASEGVRSRPGPGQGGAYMSKPTRRGRPSRLNPRAEGLEPKALLATHLTGVDVDG